MMVTMSSWLKLALVMAGPTLASCSDEGGECDACSTNDDCRQAIEGTSCVSNRCCYNNPDGTPCTPQEVVQICVES